ncbi:MAG TPA: hypothetical protein DCO79_05700 [Spirochaeta sp.]|nr:hypothetical protein [Spirochaeta sp.]
MIVGNRLRPAAVIFIIIIVSSFTACAGFNELKPGKQPGSDYEQIGSVSAGITTWNWFFQMSAGERIAALEALAAEKAAIEFGDDVIIVTETADGSWNPASLLMLFSTIGFVEDSSIEVSVWRKRPEPQLPQVLYGYRYAVVPEADYNGDWGFMEVEYRTREQLMTALEESFNKDEFSEESYKRRINRLPDTGKIFITLARKEITNAISRWFTFTCTWNGRTVFRKRGIEDIPYVYGTDRLWWNDMSYNVGPAWNGELLLRIDDSYREEVFNFKVIKEKYIIVD